MKKFLKFLLGLSLIGGAIAAVLYFFKDFFMKDYLDESDEDDFDNDLYDDDDDDDDRDYVTINPSSDK